jgi:hypothetical protein
MAEEIPEGLSEKEWADIGKMSTDRIKLRLNKEGYDKDMIAGLEG